MQTLFVSWWHRNVLLSLHAAIGFSALLTYPSNAFAQEAAPAPVPSFGQVMLDMLPMFAIIFIIFYFLVLRPQQQKLKEHQDMIGSLKKGDQVATSGGILARVASIESDHVVLEVAQNVRMRFEPSHITRRVEVKKAAN